MMIIFWSAVLILGFWLLTRAAYEIIERLEPWVVTGKLPKFLIGVTLVSLGASLPELMLSLTSLWQGDTALVAALAIGSNITNILLVVGLVIFSARELTIKRSLINFEAPFLAAAVALLLIIIWDRQVTPVDGLLFLLFFSGYLFYTFTHYREFFNVQQKQDLREESAYLPGLTRESLLYYRRCRREACEVVKLKSGLYVLLYLVLMSIASWAVFQSVSSLAFMFQIHRTILGLTVMAVGVTIPEIMVSLVAARRGAYEIAIGNIFGSNIFNILMVIGLSSLFTTLKVDAITFAVGVPSLVVTTVFYLLIAWPRRLRRWHGILFLGLYAFYLWRVLSLT